MRRFNPVDLVLSGVMLYTAYKLYSVVNGSIVYNYYYDILVDIKNYRISGSSEFTDSKINPVDLSSMEAVHYIQQLKLLGFNNNDSKLLYEYIVVNDGTFKGLTAFPELTPPYGPSLEELRTIRARKYTNISLSDISKELYFPKDPPGSKGG